MDDKVTKHKRHVALFMDFIWNQGRTQLASSLAAPDFVCHLNLVNGPLTLSVLGKLASELRTNMDDFGVITEDVICEGQRAVSQSTLCGTLNQPTMGLPASDRMLSLSLISIWEFRRGLLISCQSHIDTASLLPKHHAPKSNKANIASKFAHN